MTSPHSLPPTAPHWSPEDSSSLSQDSKNRTSSSLNSDIPFPTPAQTEKIVLFQGAVPFTSLLEVYHQKGLAAQNALKLLWSSRLNASGSPSEMSSSQSQPSALPGDRTEYIMMRGPKGKGQCQVAISSLKSPAAPANEGDLLQNSTDKDASNTSLGSASDKQKFKGFTDRFKFVAGAVKSIMGVDKKQESSEIAALMASITYVNIAWGSIVNDLLEYAKQRSEGVD